MLISTRIPEGPSPTTNDERRELLAELLGAQLGTVLFHTAASLDELEETEAAIGRLIDEVGEELTGLALDIAGGAAVIEVLVKGGSEASGARGRPAAVLGPARRSVAEQMDAWLDRVNRHPTENLRLVVDAP